MTNFQNKTVISFLSNSVKLIIACCCIAFMSLTSCGGSDDGPAKVDCANGLWTQSVQTEFSAWSAATQAYGSNPTPENCQKYKSAGQAYINALDSIKKCVPTGSIADFEESLEEAKTEINAIPCL